MPEVHVTLTAENCLRSTVCYTVKIPAAYSGRNLSMQERNSEGIRMRRVSLGRKLRAVRKDRGFTAVAVSRLLKDRFDYSIDSTTITKIETGASRPSIDFLLLACNVYRVEIGELFGVELHRFGWLLNDPEIFHQLKLAEELYGEDVRGLVRLILDFVFKIGGTLKPNGGHER